MPSTSSENRSCSREILFSLWPLIASSTDYFAPKKWLPSNCPRLQPQAPLTQATCWEEVHQLAAPSGAPHKHQPLAPAIFQSSYFGPHFFWPPWESARIKGSQFSAIEGQEIEETGGGAKTGKAVLKLLRYIGPIG